MKKKIIFIFILAIIIAPSCWGSDKIDYNASVITMDSIINYYSSMAKLGDADQDGTLNCKKRIAHFSKNRDVLITQIAQTGTFSHLARAHQICENSYKNSTGHLLYTKAGPCVTGNGYFDTLTGHKYIKNGNDTYAEYTKKGKFLKIVPSDLHLLTKRKSVYAINQGCYILYEKCLNGEMKYMSLPGEKDHPKGWKVNKLLISLN